jgi:hypothetical protein
MPDLLVKNRIFLLGCALLLLVFACGPGLCAEDYGVDWPRVAKLKPDLKVLALIEGGHPLTLKDLALLAKQGFIPADRDPGLALGLKRLVFSTILKRWMAGPRLPSGFSGRLLSRFYMTGIYRVGFIVAAKRYRGPLKLHITAPRESFGVKLLYADHVVRPTCENFIRVDQAGNRWLEADYPEVKEGEAIKFHFAFKYTVDVVKILDHDLVLAEDPMDVDIPSDVRRFLRRGHKIDPDIKEAVNWAKQGPPGSLDARAEYARLIESLSRMVRYDKPKKAAYFGGQAVYSNLDRMYQEIGVTLRNGKGCCPDTMLLECSFLRARGIPCRTAGRFGHFYSEVYLPGQGWRSTSVTPTAIPLIVAPGPDHVPYQTWTPQIPLRTTHWEARMRIQDLEEME